MTLGFTQTINGKPNGFVEKILAGLYLDGQCSIDFLVEKAREYQLPAEYFFFDSALFTVRRVTPKRHTIRGDIHGLWRAGNKIHPVINNRTPKRLQFAPTLKCWSTQTIEITHKRCGTNVTIGDVGNDFKYLGYDSIKTIALNDGFESVEDFFDYFNKDFTGKIIHWTALRY